MTMQAEALIRDVAAELHELETAVRAHPYPGAFRDGRAPLDALRHFVGHQYHTIHADIRSAALTVHRFDDGVAGKFCNTLLQGGRAGLAGIDAMAAMLGWKESDMQSYAVSGEGFAYGAYVGLLASQGTAAELACGFLVNLPAWDCNCGRIGEGLREHYGWPHEATTFFDAFSGRPAFEGDAVAVIQAGLDAGECPRRMGTSARLIQSYERMFWDAMQSLSGMDASD